MAQMMKNLNVAPPQPPQPSPTQILQKPQVGAEGSAAGPQNPVSWPADQDWEGAGSFHPSWSGLGFGGGGTCGSNPLFIVFLDQENKFVL